MVSYLSTLIEKERLDFLTYIYVIFHIEFALYIFATEKHYVIISSLTAREKNTSRKSFK